MSKPIIEVKDYSYRYASTEELVLKNITFTVNEGDFVGVVGCNRAGKSTLCKSIVGILPFVSGGDWSGEIVIDGKSLNDTKGNGTTDVVGIVFQDPDKQLFSASVEQEISFGILNLGVAKEQARTEVEQVMEELEIVPFRKRPVHALSGGQKKQVSIADILVMRPEIIILDEPAAALDPKHTRMVNEMVDKLTEQGITVLMATHDMDYAYAWADEIVLMKDGKVLCQGAPEAVCRETEKLKETNLEEPALLRLFDRLKAHKIIEATGKAPRTWKELEQLIG